MSSSLPSKVAALLRPSLTRWRRFWDVDHRAVNFYSDAEFEEALERQKEEYDRGVRDLARGHAKSELLPRLTFDLSKGIRGLSFEPRRMGLRGDLLSKNPIAFHLLLGVPLVLSIALSWALLHYAALKAGEMPPRANHVNRNVLNKRLELLEEMLDVNREQDQAATTAALTAAASVDPSGLRRTLADSALDRLLGTVFSGGPIKTMNTALTGPLVSELEQLRRSKAAHVLMSAAAIPASGAEPAAASTATAAAADRQQHDTAQLAALEERIYRLEAALARLGATDEQSPATALPRDEATIEKAAAAAAAVATGTQVHPSAEAPVLRESP